MDGCPLDRSGALQHVAAGALPGGGGAAPARSCAGAAAALADRRNALHRSQRAGADASAQPRSHGGARLYYSTAVCRRCVRSRIGARHHRTRRRRRPRAGRADARRRAGRRTGPLHAAASITLDRFRRVRRTPAPVRAGTATREAGRARPDSGTERGLRDAAPIAGAVGARHVVPHPAARPGDREPCGRLGF